MRVQRLNDSAVDLLPLYNADPSAFAALLQSASTGNAHARFDLLLIKDPSVRPVVKFASDHTESFFNQLDAAYRHERIPFADSPWPFVGGWFLYIGYEAAAETEPSLRLPASQAPTAWMVRCHAAIIVDHERGSCDLISEDSVTVDATRLAEWQTILAYGRAAAAELPIGPLAIEEDPPEAYLQAVNEALEHIRAGNVYQANLARQWSAPLPSSVTGADLYRALRRANPGPFSALARLGDFEVLSTSPERLLKIRDRRIDTRPIAGTRPRTGNDQQMIDELRHNSKEIAEHVMLIDLERNDLGRICRAGTVVVDEWMAIESYAHVHHLVSNVSGELNPDVTPGQAIRALFPGGTITGVPKVRCMQIIADLEQKPREAYTGSLGYLSRDGQMDLNILIRTAWINGQGQHRRLNLRAGAGIVADSDPQRELLETRAKARGLLRGLGLSDA